eukprot:scaffold870_cov393-Prasinococcus_capsulatus_cf.AAC.4
MVQRPPNIPQSLHLTHVMLVQDKVPFECEVHWRRAIERGARPVAVRPWSPASCVGVAQSEEYRT